MPEPDHPAVSLVGMVGGEWFGRDAAGALRSATVLSGSSRHLEALPRSFKGRRIAAPASVGRWLDLAAAWAAEGERVCLLVSGDPGFFGLMRAASARLGPNLRSFPAPSTVALAFSSAGVGWDDALVVSAHGRPLEPALEAAMTHPKVAVLCSPDNPPQLLAARLVEAGCGPRRALVFSRMGEPAERRWEGDLSALAGEVLDGLSVCLLLAPGAQGGAAPALSWGLPEELLDHRAGMITKAEVRAVALGKLALPPVGVMWDIGAGSGSVSLECSRLCPGLRVFAVERRPEEVARLKRNLSATPVEIVEGEAPEALEGLPDPDRVFAGGGGPAILDAILPRLRPGGVVVATYASFARAAAGAERLGNVAQVSVSRGVPSGVDGSFRLQAENPVFVCWGPR